jgi:glycosyltransferase involved in cell wall biosynthesis
MLRVNVTVPVYNEEGRLPPSADTLRRYLDSHREFCWEVVIADNGSQDGTLGVAAAFEKEHPDVRVVHLEAKGRGRALRHVWSQSGADILSYIDVDLSTDLSAFQPLVQALASGKYDLAVGSRLCPGSRTRRCWRREAISRCYMWLVKAAFGSRFSDAQCGFKAITREAAARLLPAVEDTGWFFDTELLVLAERCGYRVFDLPVRWTEDPDSRVKILRTAWEDLRGILRLYRKLRRREYASLMPDPAPAK